WGVLLRPAERTPTLISGRSVCWGCGSEFMSCGRLSLLTNVTREPAATVTALGETPAAVIVIVAAVPVPPPPPPQPPDGAVGLSLPPPHEDRTNASAHAPTNRGRREPFIGRISPRC